MKKNKKPIRKTKELNSKPKITMASSKKIKEQAISGKSIENKKPTLAAIQRRQDRSRSIYRSIFVLLIMIITVLIIIQVMKKNEPNPQFMFIQNGFVQHNITSKALIIRDESVFISPNNGYLKPVIQSGSRISFGQTAAVITKDSDEEMLTTLKNYEKQISELQSELVLSGKGTGAKSIYDEANENISRLIDLIRRDTMSGVMSTFPSYKSSITVAIQRRQTRLQSIDFNDSRLTELKKQKEKLENKLEIVAGNIILETPGILSYHIDGLEEKLKPEFIDKISIEEFKDLSQKSKYVHTTGQYLQKDDKALKIAKGIYQYILVVIPSNSESEFTDNSIHSIGVQEKGTEISGCEVIRKYVNGDEALIAFRTDRKVVRFVDYRIINVSLSTKITKGLKVPISSLLDISQDGKTADIMIVVKGYAKKMKIKILDKDSDYAIIDLIKESDDNLIKDGYLVKNPESISEGDNLGGK